MRKARQMQTKCWSQCCSLQSELSAGLASQEQNKGPPPFGHGFYAHPHVTHTNCKYEHHLMATAPQSHIRSGGQSLVPSACNSRPRQGVLLAALFFPRSHSKSAYSSEVQPIPRSTLCSTTPHPLANIITVNARGVICHADGVRQLLRPRLYAFTPRGQAAIIPHCAQ